MHGSGASFSIKENPINILKYKATRIVLSLHDMYTANQKEQKNKTIKK